MDTRQMNVKMVINHYCLNNRKNREPYFIIKHNKIIYKRYIVTSTYRKVYKYFRRSKGKTLNEKV